MDTLIKYETTCLKIRQYGDWFNTDMRAMYTVISWVFVCVCFETTVADIQFCGVSDGSIYKWGDWRLGVTGCSVWVRMEVSVVLCRRPFELQYQTNYFEWLCFYCLFIVLILFLEIYIYMCVCVCVCVYVWNFSKLSIIFPFFITCRTSVVLLMGLIDCLLSKRCCAYFDVSLLYLSSRKCSA